MLGKLRIRRRVTPLEGTIQWMADGNMWRITISARDEAGSVVPYTVAGQLKPHFLARQLTDAGLPGIEIGIWHCTVRSQLRDWSLGRQAGLLLQVLGEHYPVHHADVNRPIEWAWVAEV